MTESQKLSILGIVGYGCDRVTAAGYAGRRREELDEAVARDEDFARALRIAEGKADLKHMAVVEEAAKDPKNWRTATWWLERRERLREDDDDPTVAQVMELVDALSQVVATEIKDNELLRRVTERMWDVVGGREQPRIARISQMEGEETE